MKMAPQNKKDAKSNKLLDPILSLTWEDLEEWAGKRIVVRGRSYHSRGAVQDLERTEDGALVASVEGTRRYATRVGIRKGKKLESECTCPYWTTCKHAVAVVLKYLECVRTGVVVEEVEAQDAPHLRHLDVRQEEFDDLPETEISATGSLGAFLQEKTKAELVSLMVELAEAHEEARQWLEDHRALTLGRIDEIHRVVCREIEALEEPDWIHDQYGPAAPVFNADRLKAALSGLIKAGHAAAAVRFGPELLFSCGRLIEHDHEGEAFDEIGACLEVLFEALHEAFPSSADQVEWVLDMDLADEYSLCSEGREHFWSMRRSANDWSAVADRLGQRLEEHESAGKGKGFSRHYERNRISNWLILALERAGREEEIIPLCECEAPITFSYDRLVAHLIRERRWDEAIRWCLRGMDAVSSEYPGIEKELHRQLRTIHKRRGDPLAGLAIEAEEFFASPSLSHFQELCKAARKEGVGEGVEAWARRFLETGRRPVAGRKNEIGPGVDWPLPASEIEMPAYSPATGAPMTRILIRLAISEKKPEEALKWYDHEHNNRRGYHLMGHSLDTEVAEAVSSTHPDRAIAIWKKMAEQHIARVKPSGYEAAAPYLRKVRNAFIKTGCKQDWEAYLASLRQRNSRRPRCMEVLDRLEHGPRKIIDT